LYPPTPSLVLYTHPPRILYTFPPFILYFPRYFTLSSPTVHIDANACAPHCDCQIPASLQITMAFLHTSSAQYQYRTSSHHKLLSNDSRFFFSPPPPPPPRQHVLWTNCCPNKHPWGVQRFTIVRH
jgi:hypothetical protein